MSHVHHPTRVGFPTLTLPLLFALAACSGASQDEDSRSTATAAQSPGAASAASGVPGQDAMTGALNQVARTLPRGTLGPRYCLVRKIQQADGTWAKSRLPTIAVPRAEDWITHNDIPLVTIDHASNCPPTRMPWQQRRLKIDQDVAGTFPSSVVSSTAHLQAGLSGKLAAERNHPDAYLHAHSRCAGGSSGCGDMDVFDAYLYVVDITSDDRSDVPKLVFLDLFKPSDPSNACKAERPEYAVEPRGTTDCPLPDWVRLTFPDLFETMAAASWDGNGGDTGHLETGSGGGYEPP